jgi:hypothetical protein
MVRREAVNVSHRATATRPEPPAKGNAMQFTLTISLDNDDAHQGGPDALAGYLRDVASNVQAGHGTGRVRDLNGNTIGQYDITDD